MRVVCLAIVLLAAMLGGTASASTVPNAPTDLHGFLLRADETPPTAFHRTPSFAWSPVPGALGYQFQLSTSSTFRDNGLIYNTNTLTTPVVAPPLVLPWITGSPHALYARVRATVRTVDSDVVTPWSDAYGFDVLPPAPPTPMASDSGLLRWTPIEGADSYEVWLIDVRLPSFFPTGKKEIVRTNVLDEREFYTFHQNTRWIGSVHWRIRAIRSGNGRPANGLPAVTYGAWSPVYNSTNPALASPGQPIALTHTISDVTSNGTPGSPAHQLMPAFTWTGNTSLNGTAAELFRVYVFTDRQCLNLVYASPVVGSPTYAPRPGGPMSLPGDSAGIAAARGGYLKDDVQMGGQMYDGTPVIPQEQVAPASPTLAAPTDNDPPSSSPPPVAAAPPSAGASSGSGSGSGSGSNGSSSPIVGAPVSLWDTFWPQSGYYWTVIPVAAAIDGAGFSTVSAPGGSKGSTLVRVTDTSQFSVGETITIGSGVTSDTAAITAIGGGLITLSAALNNGHAAGEPIVATSAGSVTYRDLDLPQEACAAGRVKEFGVASEPTLTSGQDPFATGLSADGQLTAASGTPTFYGSPLVAWTPALGAQIYEVQWSKQVPGTTTAYPFKAESSLMTTSTAAVLPLAPGTWYYRVRGFDYNLPTGAQQMSWSDEQLIVVTTPKFTIVPQPKKEFQIVGGGAKAAPAIAILRTASGAFESYKADNAPGNTGGKLDPDPIGSGYNGMTIAYLTKHYDNSLDQRIKIVRASATTYCAQVTVKGTAAKSGPKGVTAGRC